MKLLIKPHEPHTTTDELHVYDPSLPHYLILERKPTPLCSALPHQVFPA